jgi:lysine-N-methylase
VGDAPAITARYLRRFQCLGPSCEDTCCQGWIVPLDRRQYQITRAAMEASPADAEAFQAGVEVETRPEDERHARIRLRSDGTCPFLAPEKLCSIQSRHGEAALPAVCSTYPRLVAQSGARLEVWGSTSCPEMARQVLLHEDALDLVDAPPETTPRWVPARTLPAEPQRPYDRYLDDVRGTAFALLSNRAHRVRTRLFLLAYLGKETQPFFRRDAPAIDEVRLAAAFAQVTDPATIARWDQELDGLPPPRAMTANLVAQLVAAQGALEGASLHRLVAQVLAGYAACGGVVAGAIDPAALWAEHARRRDHWQAGHGDRLDLYFENYAKNFWMLNWHTMSIDLLAHARRLLVRVAVLRFLLFGHPGLEAAAALPDRSSQQEALDRIAVEVCYKVSRGVEHQGTFLDRIAGTVVGEGLQTFAHSTFLALV